MRPYVLACALAALAPLAFGPSPAAADAAAGRAKAQQQCAVCHGIDGIARTPDAANLAGESEFYLTRQLEAFRSGERRHEQMSIIAEALTDQDIADLADWYSNLEISVQMPQ